MRIMIMNCSIKNAWYKVGNTYTVTKEDDEYYYVKSKSGLDKVPKKDAEVI